jgi:hypothetical protein
MTDPSDPEPLCPSNQSQVAAREMPEAMFGAVVHCLKHDKIFMARLSLLLSHSHALGYRARTSESFHYMPQHVHYEMHIVDKEMYI